MTNQRLKAIYKSGYAMGRAQRATTCRAAWLELSERYAQQGGLITAARFAREELDKLRANHPR